MQYLEISDLELEEVRNKFKDQIILMGHVTTFQPGALLLISELDSLENEMVNVEDITFDLISQQTTLILEQ